MTKESRAYTAAIRARIHDQAWIVPGLAALDETMEQDGGHDYAHLTRVLVNATRIAKGEAAHNPDLEVIAAAVTFHDVINLPKNSPDRHLASTKSAEFAVKNLEPYFSEERLAKIEEAIRTHSYSSGFQPECIEAKIVTDADRLESLGAFGIARTFYVSGVMGRSILDQSDPFAERRELDDLEFALDHFPSKLLKLRERMTTQTGREMAEQRHRFLEVFLDQVRLEVQDE